MVKGYRSNAKVCLVESDAATFRILLESKSKSMWCMEVGPVGVVAPIKSINVWVSGKARP